jgi:hypothetical protein
MLSGARNKSRALRDKRHYAEERYFRYEREVKQAVERAYDQMRTGDLDGAATTLTAGAASMTALVGVTRELHLLYSLGEDETADAR